MQQKILKNEIMNIMNKYIIYVYIYIPYNIRIYYEKYKTQSLKNKA